MATNFPHFYKQFSHKAKLKAFREVSTSHLLSHVLLYLKKTLCAILIIQLAFPQSVLMAMERDNGLASQLCPLGETSRTQPPLIEKLKALHRAQNTLPKLIDDDSIPEQTIEDSYVDLTILSDGKTVDDKQSIDPNQIFEEKEKQEPKEHVVVIGDPGTGKSAFICRYIPYEHAHGRFFPERFDSVFTIKLKKLTTPAWNAQLSSLEDPLEKLIYESLKSQRAELQRKGVALPPELRQEEVIAYLKDEGHRARILLLLDGYDEITHLVNNPDHIAYEVVNKIFEYPYLVVTSRPGALTSQMMDRFSRKIKNKGLSTGNVRTYIDKYFDHQAIGAAVSLTEYYKNCKEGLIDLIHRNPTVATALTTPLNALMMCLVSTDPDFRRRFSGDFSIGQLYHDVIVWLGKRYANKFQSKDITQFVPEHVFEMDELKALEEITYKSFTEGHLSMTGEEIATAALKINRSLTFQDVMRYGLLRVENTNGTDDPLKQGYVPIHLSFQEYLIAHHLKTRLLKGTDSEIMETTQFIGEHRNDPKYLMILKLMAGLVSAEQDTSREASGSSSSLTTRSPLVPRFWDAVTCNVDGVLELGLENKITLLMHLLAQGKRDGQFDPRNPHLPALMKLIDEVVLKDIVSWGEQIIQSGYLSEVIVDNLNAVLSGDKEAKTHELKTSMEVISNLVRRSEFGGREAVFRQLMHILEHTEDWQLKKLGLQKLGQIMDRSIPEIFLQNCLATIIPLLEDENFSNDVSDLLPNIIKASLGLTGEVFSFLEPLLKDSAWEKRRAREAAAKSLGKIVKAVPVLSAQVFSFFESILRDSQQEIRTGTSLSLGEVVQTVPFVASQALLLLEPLLKDPNDDTRRAAALYLGKIVKAVPELAPQVFSLLVPLLKDSWGIVRQVAALRLREVAQANPQTLPFFIPLLKDFERDIRKTAAKSLGAIVKAAPSVAPQLFSLLEPLLKDPHGYCREGVALSLGEIAQTAPFVASQALLLLEPLLKDIDWNVRNAAAQNLEVVVKATPAIASQTVSLLAPLLKDPNAWVRRTAVCELATIVTMDSILASQELPLFIPLLNDPDKDVKSSTALHLGRVVKAAPTVASQLFSLLVPLLQDPKREARENAAKSLGEVAQVAPTTIASQVFSLVAPLLEDSEWTVRGATAKSLGDVAKAAPEMAPQIFSLVAPPLLDPEWSVRTAAIQSLGEVVQVTPAMAPQALCLLEPLLKDHTSSIRSHAARSLREVMKAVPAVIPQILPLLEPLLKDSDFYVRLAAAESLKEIVLVDSAKAQDVITLLATHDVFSGDDRAKKLFVGFPLTTLAHFLAQPWLNADAREAFETALLSRLKSAEKLSHEEILPLLTVIDLTKDIDSIKELHLVTKEVLKQLIDILDETGVAWINAHFDQLPNLPERQIFLKGVYHTLLKRGHINETGRDFIIRCIQSGLTTSITRSGTLIHEGVTYTLSPESKQHLSAITEASLQQDDRLAEQYRSYQPLFSNNKVGLRMAASDIADVPSLAGSDSLSGGCWRLTLLTSDTSSSPFILLEKRNRFGDHIAQKFNTLGQALSPRYVCHPERTTRVFREGLFGAHTLSIYTAQSILLSEDKKRELFFEGSAGSAPIIDPQLEAPETWEGFKTRLFEQTAKRYSLTQGDLLGIDHTSPEGQLMRQEKALQDAGVYDLATIRRGFHALETLPPQLRNYAQTFYWTMANYFEAYRSISTGLFQTNTSAEIKTEEQIGFKIAKKGAQYIAEVLKPVPVLGSAVALLDTLIDDIMGMVEQTRFENKVNAIMRIIREKCHLAQDISSTIMKVALEGTTVKTQAILHPAPKVTDASMMGNLDRLKSAFEEKFAAFKDAILPTIELNDPADPGVQLALKDVALTMAYLFKNHEEIISNKEPLDIQMIEIIRNGSLERLLSPLSLSSSVSKSSQQTNAVAPTAVNDNSQTGITSIPKSGKKTTCVTS
jgi:HEAT repeat protein